MTAAGALAADSRAEFLAEVLAGLSAAPQKELPCRWFYDDLGSALFEAIARLPEYGLTRADSRLLETHNAEIAEKAGRPAIVAELGSGSGTKTRWLLEALARRGEVRYFPSDISRLALESCRREMEKLSGVTVIPLERPYLDGLLEAGARREGGERMLVLFLGSTIGNFDRHQADQFLFGVRQRLQEGDGLLLGTDLVKPAEQLIAAYDDELGVTAAFNRNLLGRINRELGGDFMLEHFAHEVRWDSRRRRIEMHLKSLRRQLVSIGAADMAFVLKRNETIRTECCHKYAANRIPFLAQRAGFHCAAQWIDREWGFAENLFIAAACAPW